MSLEDLAGKTYGPVTTEISAAKVAEYVDATGDQRDRWCRHAPPSYAGALLFVLAPRFLFSNEVLPYTKVLVHSDQRFQWHGPLTIGDEVTVTAEVSRVRVRGSMHFVKFTAWAANAAGRVLDSESTFVMAAEGGPDPAPEEVEPPVGAAAGRDKVRQFEMDGVPGVLPSMTKSASRIDLVRYAAASGDFNPIHYDHETGRAAGFEGVIVHGLLMGAWAAQLAAATTGRPDPLADLRLRFKNALRPAVAATVSGTVESAEDGLATVILSVRTQQTELVSGRATVRRE